MLPYMFLVLGFILFCQLWFAAIGLILLPAQLAMQSLWVYPSYGGPGGTFEAALWNEKAWLFSIAAWAVIAGVLHLYVKWTEWRATQPVMTRQTSVIVPHTMALALPGAQRGSSANLPVKHGRQVPLSAEEIADRAERRRVVEETRAARLKFERTGSNW